MIAMVCISKKINVDFVTNSIFVVVMILIFNKVLSFQFQQKGNKTEIAAFLYYSILQTWFDEKCQTCEIILIYMNNFPLKSSVLFHLHVHALFITKNFVHKEKSHFQCLYFLFISRFLIKHPQTQPLIYVVYIYSKWVHCWKRKSLEFWEGIQALQIISTYFPKSILFFLQCLHFLDSQVHSL